MSTFEQLMTTLKQEVRTAEEIFERQVREGNPADIGREIASISTASRVLAYAEVEGGVVSVSVFDVNDDAALYRESSETLDNLFYDFWEAWNSQPGANAWRLAVYKLDRGKFSIDLSYPNGVDPSLDRVALRRETLKKHLGSLPIKFR